MSVYVQNRERPPISGVDTLRLILSRNSNTRQTDVLSLTTLKLALSRHLYGEM